MGLSDRLHLIDAVGIYEIDLEGRRLFVNRRWSEITGLDGEAALAARVQVHPEDQARVLGQWDSALRAQQALTVELRIIRPDGAVRWCRSAATPMPDEAGRPIGYLGTVADIGEAKRWVGELERQRRALVESRAELEALSYSVSHDLRAPLRAIDGFSRILIDDYGADLPPGAHALLDRVRQASRRMAVLIDGILELTKLVRVPMGHASVDLSALAVEVGAELAAVHPERVVELAVAPGLTVAGDRRYLRELIRHLLDNAWQHTRERAVAHVEVGARAGAEPIYFVSDDGIGFDMRYAGRLFAPFQRLHAGRDPDAVGIGLAAAQRIVHRHGGRIWAESAEGRGAAFFFTLAGRR
jgi:PAS domain S-box-containing protein